MEFMDAAFWMIGASITLLCGAILILLLIAQVIIMGNRLQHRLVSHVGGWKAWRDYTKWYRANKNDKDEE